jgi:hypothetical protein
MPSLPGIFTDCPAPIVRNTHEGREIVRARWGMPTPQAPLMEAIKKRRTNLRPKPRQPLSCATLFIFGIRHDRRQEGAGLG